jgi:hypothetical protein
MVENYNMKLKTLTVMILVLALASCGEYEEYKLIEKGIRPGLFGTTYEHIAIQGVKDKSKITSGYEKEIYYLLEVGDHIMYNEFTCEFYIEEDSK